MRKQVGRRARERAGADAQVRQRDPRGAIFRSVLCAALVSSLGGAPARAQDAVSPLASPSLYEEQGVVSRIDAASGTVTINGKQYRTSPKTIVYVVDSSGRSRRANRISELPPDTSISFSAGSDGTLTHVRAGAGIRPYRP